MYIRRMPNNIGKALFHGDLVYLKVNLRLALGRWVLHSVVIGGIPIHCGILSPSPTPERIETRNSNTLDRGHLYEVLHNLMYINFKKRFGAYLWLL